MMKSMVDLDEFKQLLRQDKRLRFAFSAFVVSLFVIPGVLYTQSDSFKTNNPNPNSQVLGTNSISLDQVNDLVKKVSKLADIPSETPNIATVNDATQVRNQPFFANAENGDKVLIFQQAQKAILYRPSTNKIINYSTIQVAVESPTPAPGATSSGSLTPTPIQIQPTIHFQPVTATPTPYVTPGPSQ